MLKSISHTTLKRSDQAVYEMFGLTEEKRDVIEDSLGVF